MNSGIKPWDSSTQLQNLQAVRNQNGNPSFSSGRPAPVLPPRPVGSGFGVNSYNQYSSPYSLSSKYFLKMILIDMDQIFI